MERDRLIELLRDWKPPAELNRSTPREVRLNGRGVGVMVLMVVLLAGGLGLAVWLGAVAERDSERARLLREQGADAQGTVTRLWRKGDDANWVAFQFPVDGHLESRSVKVRRSVWNRLAANQTVAVRYLPSRPSISYLRGSEPKAMAGWATWLMGFSLWAPALLLPVVVQRERRLLTVGRAAPGVVTRLRRMKHGWMVYYEFAITGGGSPQTGKTGPNSKPPAVGATVPVVYDPENPSRNRLYPFSLVKIAEY